MTVAPPHVKIYTAEEYLTLEVESDTRSEFRSGEIVAMTGERLSTMKSYEC